MTKREHENRVRVLDRLRDLGFTYQEAESLRRIEMTLQRWAERECGDGSDWVIERDETTDKPCLVYHGEHAGKNYYHFRRQPIADREAGATRRMNAIVAARNARRPDQVIAYNQGDCRGCMVYIVPAAELEADKPDSIHSLYTRGIAVCA